MAHYFESHLIPKKIGDATEVLAFFQVLDKIKPGLEMTITASSLEMFELYRPKMNDFFQSLRFD